MKECVLLAMVGRGGGKQRRHAPGLSLV